MIHVERSNVPIPAVLRESGSKGAREKAEAVTFYSNPANRGETFDKFEVYKDKSVKRALNELFHSKCAYCESRIGATQPMDVEHYRPKGGMVVDGELKKPGYYWLAADWDNLFPSCIDCNRSRTQEFPDSDPRKAGKANLFPIDGRRAAVGALGEELLAEQPLLLDPCWDRPEEYLEYLGDKEKGERGLVRPVLGSNGKPRPKGKTSIEVYGLQRKGLVNERRDRLMLILAQIKTVDRVLTLFDQDPSDENKAWLNDEMAQLERLQRDDQPYAGMARQFIGRFRASRRV